MNGRSVRLKRSDHAVNMAKADIGVGEAHCTAEDAQLVHFGYAGEPLGVMHRAMEADDQREMDNLRSERDKTLIALRDLEMGNDELERNER